VNPGPVPYAAPLQGLFPAGTVVAVLRTPADPSLLYPAEALCVAQAVRTRVEEFAAGRLCARAALAELGIIGCALLAAADRAPVWPAGIVGSIAHTSGHCAAVAGSRSLFLGLGLDTELLAAVRAQLWHRLCAPSELARLRALPQAQRARAAALSFAAKEAFYKAQYPLTREALDFDAVVIDYGSVDCTAGEFTVVPRRSIALERIARAPVRGRFAFHEGFVSAGIALAAAG
jgi:4'-phosphopantetheinyl transferase EntD